MSSATPAGRLTGRSEVAGAGGIELEARSAIGTVGQTPVSGPAVKGVEGDRCQPIAVVGFPLVDLAVRVAVLFRRHDAVGLEMLDPRDFPVPSRRDLNAVDGACRARERPGVLFPVLGAREADFLDLLVGPVILPAVDLAVLVGIDI